MSDFGYDPADSWGGTDYGSTSDPADNWSGTDLGYFDTIQNDNNSTYDPQTEPGGQEAAPTTTTPAKPEISRDKYEQWKKNPIYTPNDVYTQEEIEQFHNWRYDEWSAGAYKEDFSADERKDFEKRDAASGGGSDARRKADAEQAVKSVTKVFFYQSDDKTQPGYVEAGDPKIGRPAGVYKYTYIGNGVWKWKIVKDYSRVNTMLDEINEFEFPTFEEWAAETGNSLTDVKASEEYSALKTLTEELANGTISEDAINEAMSYAARSLGYANEKDFKDYQQQVIGSKIGDMQGMGDTEYANRQQMNRETIRQQELNATRALESIRASGRSTAMYLMRADEYLSNITSERVKAQDMLAKENWERKKAEWDAQQRQYEFQVQTGAMARTEYLQLYQQNRALALQGYATQISAMFQENQEVFQQYQSDMQSMSANLANMYAAMQAELGFDQTSVQFAEQVYSNDVLPLLNDLEILSQETRDYLADRALDIQETANVMQFVGGIIGTIGKIFNPFG